MHASISLPSFKITILTSRLPIPVPILAPPIAARTEAQESRRGARAKDAYVDAAEDGQEMNNEWQAPVSSTPERPGTLDWSSRQLSRVSRMEAGRMNAFWAV